MNKWVTVLAVTLPSPEVIEHARKCKGIPSNWDYAPCAAGCGEIVFFSPAGRDAAQEAGVPFAVVCSLACAQEWSGT